MPDAIIILLELQTTYLFEIKHDTRATDDENDVQ